MQNTSHHTDMTKPTIADLVKQGRHAAEAYDECDAALTQLNDSFGKPYEASRCNLTNELIQADVSGLDLTVFQGEKSLFRFPDLDTNIVVRIRRVPVGTDKLDKIDQKIAEMEQKLKLLKNQRKRLIEDLKIIGDTDFITDAITTAFQRIK